MSTKTVELPQGRIEYRDEGEGPVILFSHGIFVTTSLWDGMVEQLVPAGYRCIRPETPMGGHRIPLNPDAELAPPRIADLLADFIDELGLDRPAVCGSDSGGAIAQMLAARHPEKIGALILTNCDALEVYPPVPFNLLPRLARLPGGIAPLGFLMRLKPVRWASYRLLTVDPIPDSQIVSWLKPSWVDPQIRRDINKLITGVEKRQAIDAAEALRDFTKPVLMTWGDRDIVFKPDLARRLAAMIPDVRLAFVPGGRTFVAIDKPEEVSRLIMEFMAEQVKSGVLPQSEAVLSS